MSPGYCECSSNKTRLLDSNHYRAVQANRLTEIDRKLKSASGRKSGAFLKQEGFRAPLQSLRNTSSFSIYEVKLRGQNNPSFVYKEVGYMLDHSSF